MSEGGIRASEITPQAVYEGRRRFLRLGVAAAAAPLIGRVSAVAAAMLPRPLRESPFSTRERKTPLRDITHYNNFYELATDKYSPAALAKALTTHPWSVRVDGLVRRPAIYDVDALMRRFPIEERIYRLRCVEGWSMVIPWDGFPLASLLKTVEPLGSARFVEFTSVLRPDELAGQRVPILHWPYVEGLRLDEAMHPLTILAVGLYGQTLPKQDGAPIRVVVPWKYGFKSAKSIVRVRLLERQPLTTWNRAAPDEYGFYANVNPRVDTVRWSQARERRIGEFFKRKTLMFNGYGAQVASLYAGMDLKTDF